MSCEITNITTNSKKKKCIQLSNSLSIHIKLISEEAALRACYKTVNLLLSSLWQ